MIFLSCEIISQVHANIIYKDLLFLQRAQLLHACCVKKLKKVMGEAVEMKTLQGDAHIN